MLRPVSRFLFAALAILAAALPGCGGSGGPPPFEPFVAQFPDEGPGTPGGPSIPIPPPQGRRPAAWDPDAFPLGRVAVFGSFPSDVVRFQDTVFTTDADAVERDGARVVAVDASGAEPAPSLRFADTVVLPSHLVDSAGLPADPDAPIAFGPFLNDLLVAGERLAFVLANAGGSDSAPTLSNLVVFDPTEGEVIQVVDLAHVFSTGGPLLDSAGAPVPGGSFVQAGAEGLALVPTEDGRALLFVAMSNFVIGFPSFGAVKYPGTVQVFDVDLDAPAPVAPLPVRTLRTAAYNPSAVTLWRTAHGHERLLVTAAGTTAFDASFRLVPVTAASVEVYDRRGETLLGTFGLGLAGLSSSRPALGYDAAGHAVGFFPSSVTGEVYVLRLDGLDAQPVDAHRVAVLRGPQNGIPIDPSSAGLPGGNVHGIALTPSGRTLVVSGFGDLFAFPTPRPGRLLALSLPLDLVGGGSFGVGFVPGTTNLVTIPGRTLGALALGPSADGPDVYVAVGGAIDPVTFAGAGPASLGTLSTFGAIR